jgi:hypothetical protein
MIYVLGYGTSGSILRQLQKRAIVADPGFPFWIGGDRRQTGQSAENRIILK